MMPVFVWFLLFTSPTSRSLCSALIPQRIWGAHRTHPTCVSCSPGDDLRLSVGFILWGTAEELRKDILVVLCRLSQTAVKTTLTSTSSSADTWRPEPGAPGYWFCVGGLIPVKSLKLDPEVGGSIPLFWSFFVLLSFLFSNKGWSSLNARKEKKSWLFVTFYHHMLSSVRSTWFRWFCWFPALRTFSSSLSVLEIERTLDNYGLDQCNLRGTWPLEIKPNSAGLTNVSSVNFQLIFH